MKKILLGCGIVVALSFASCAASHVESSEPNYQVDAAVGVAPGPEYVWVNHEYVWRGGRYAVVPGYWARRPRVGVVWHTGSWYRGGRGWRWHGGYWR